MLAHRLNGLTSTMLSGGESGIRTRPFFETSCCQGDGENPCEHSHSSTISSPSYLSNVARFDCASVFLKLMELMRPSCSRRGYLRSLAERLPEDGHDAGKLSPSARYLADCLLGLQVCQPTRPLDPVYDLLLLNRLLLVDAEHELPQRLHLMPRGEDVARTRHRTSLAIPVFRCDEMHDRELLDIRGSRRARENGLGAIAQHALPQAFQCTAARLFSNGDSDFLL